MKSHHRITAAVLSLFTALSLLFAFTGCDKSGSTSSQSPESNGSNAAFSGADSSGSSQTGETSGISGSLSFESSSEETSSSGNSNEEEHERARIIACSDIQQDDGNDSNVSYAKEIFTALKNEGVTSSVDGFFCAGDYTRSGFNSVSQTTAGLNAIKRLVSQYCGKDTAGIYLDGNHDPDSMIDKKLTASGANDSEKYGVFVINERDYMWYNSDETAVKNIADELQNYLLKKAEAGYDKPIFVISHLALHYSMRTRSGGGDGKYAGYIFNALNTAGNAGLNIVFLYGHNHSHGWDNYLGGGSVYLPKGANINIAKIGSTTSFNKETLAFTYLNAGYVGYYTDSNNNSDKTLTMTVFDIDNTDHTLTISRYDKNGLHLLKAKGVSNAEYPDGTYYRPNTEEIESPQMIHLNTQISIPQFPSDPEDVPPENTVYTAIHSLAELTDGQYLLVYRDSTNYILSTEYTEVTSSSGTRGGMKLTETNIDGKYLTENYDSYEWTIEKRETGWLLRCPSGELTLTSTPDKGITASPTPSGSPFTVSYTGGGFTFTSGSYMLNFNASRLLINGFAGNPAGFVLYIKTAA